MSANNVASQKAMESSVVRTASLLGIAINYSIYHVLQDVKNGECSCVNDWRLTFCTYYSLVLIGINSVVLIFGSAKLLQRIMPVVHILNFVNIMSLITYLHKLSQTECNCEQSSLQRIMRYVGYVLAFFYTIGFINMIFFVGSLLINEKKSKK
jgi:hypothetical protein